MNNTTFRNGFLDGQNVLGKSLGILTTTAIMPWRDTEISLKEIKFDAGTAGGSKIIVAVRSVRLEKTVAVGGVRGMTIK